MNESLKKWIKDNNLSCKINDNILEIEEVGKFLIIGDQEFTFDDRFILNLTDNEIDLLDSIDYLLFKFGSFWFYQHKDDENIKLNFFRYLGKSNKETFGVPFLAIHGKYELCNGSRDYFDWAKKAKFLGYQSIGLCELQTLAGNNYFQKACDKVGIKAIHGRTNKVQSTSGTFYFVKSYAKNKKGWKELLEIHNIEIIERNENGKYITESEFFDISKNLFNIICHDTDLNLVDLSKYDLQNTFFQFNPVEYKSNKKDEEHLLSLKKYLMAYKTKLSPIILQDAYYLDKNDDIIKPLLNKISGNTFQFASQDEYMKPFEDIIAGMYNLFSSEIDFENLVEESFSNYSKILNECDFVLKREGMHLPKYKMNDDEKKLYSDNEDMFFSLIEKGFNEKILHKVDGREKEYIDRINKEVEVLQEGGVIDYFLILYDVFNFLKKHCSITSLGRGSSAGSLVSFLLDIVQIDPIKYDLLFERFLNKARLFSGSLPDIDSDIPSFFRQNVIDFLIEKYGKDNVACIGTAQNFKLKSTLKDFLKMKGVSFADSNILTSFFTKEFDNKNIEGLFEVALTEKRIKDIIKKFPEIVYEIYLCIFQPRSFGIHAAGVVIFPEYDSEGNKTKASNYLSLRKSDDGQLVTEWEKEAVEDNGFLKADLLGLTQLDKIIRMNELIVSNGKKYKAFPEIDLEDDKVLKLFREGITEDIFQFNTDVQKNYLLQLMPDNIEDLVAANALNRPGAMESNSHIKYVKIKNGEEKEEYPPLLEDVLKNTRSVWSYQEHAMFAYQILTNCDLNETDNFRKIISKSKPNKVDPIIEQYKENFIKGYMDKGIDISTAKDVWDRIMGFTSYSFNRSHAVSYAVTGYWAAYYKAYFPVEFYTTSLEFANSSSKKDDLLPRIISEIQTSNLVELKHPDINISGTQYNIDVEKNSIYWSLSSVKYAGKVAIETLLKDREERGRYFSFEEFLSRRDNMKVNKRVITNFILTGCFDEIENIKEEKDRFKLLKFYYDSIKEELPKEIIWHKDVDRNHFWIMLQKQFCGLGNINYEQIYKTQKAKYWVSSKFCDPYLLQDNLSIDKNVVVAGILEEIIERDTKKGGQLCQLKLNCNNTLIYITVWNDQYKVFKELLKESLFQPIFVSGTVIKDTYKKVNIIKTNFKTQIVKA